jgi:hypothetical protein
MKSLAKIEIFQPGIVIFDPVALKDFVVINGVACKYFFVCFFYFKTNIIFSINKKSTKKNKPGQAKNYSLFHCF